MKVSDFVKNGEVAIFSYFRDNQLWYIVNGFEFPIPILDVGTATFRREEKAIMMMRWIRKHIEWIESSKTSTTEF